MQSAKMKALDSVGKSARKKMVDDMRARQEPKAPLDLQVEIGLDPADGEAVQRPRPTDDRGAAFGLMPSESGALGQAFKFQDGQLSTQDPDISKLKEVPDAEGPDVAPFPALSGEAIDGYNADAKAKAEQSGQDILSQLTPEQLDMLLDALSKRKATRHAAVTTEEE